MRHSITNTNYYVEVFAEGASGLEALDVPETDPDLDTADLPPAEAQLPLVAPETLLPEHISLDPEAWMDIPEEPFRGEAGGRAADELSLLTEIPAAESSLRWLATQRLHAQPLTGLARKALQRLGLMPMLPVRVHGAKGAV